MNTVKPRKIRKIHFTGIKGVGMAPLAIIAKEAGFKVTGSDIAEEFITDESLRNTGITVLIGFSEDHINGSDLVIATGAHGGFDNPEVKAAKAKGILVWSHGQALGEFMKGDILKRKFEGISVAGSHGKTTTTAMLATLFSSVGLDPTYLVGTGSIAPLSSPGHLGRGRYFICEADEYATEINHDKTPRFLWQHPKIAVFTNIEHDHPDLYPTVEDVKNAFVEFSKNISSDGFLVYCHDNALLKQLKHETTIRTVSYGFSPESDYVLENVSVSETQTFFWVKSKGVSLGSFTINVMGVHNALNALSAIAVGIESGLSIEKIQKGIASFYGSKRRMEYVGTMEDGAMAFDDYAHHPTEIATTLSAFRKAFPKKKIICLFQPHMYSRTKALLPEFAKAFSEADKVYLVDIFPSAREEPDPTISSKILWQNIAEHHKNSHYLGSLAETASFMDSFSFGEDAVVITMGAGDIYSIWKKVIPASK